MCGEEGLNKKNVFLLAYIIYMQKRLCEYPMVCEYPDDVADECV